MAVLYKEIFINNMEIKNKEKFKSLIQLLEQNINAIDDKREFLKLTIELNFANGVMDNKIKMTPVRVVLL